MRLSTKDIFKYLIKPLKVIEGITICVESDYTINIDENSIFPISYVSFDGETHDTTFFISFYDSQISILISDENLKERGKNAIFWTFNEKFMFIDDELKKELCSCDTYGNVVYEGLLSDKTSKKILELLASFVIILVGAKSIKIEEIVIEGLATHERGYPLCDYVVKIINSSDEKKEVTFDNIKFIINEHLDN